MRLFILLSFILVNSLLLSQNKSIDIGVKLGGGISFMTGKYAKGLKPNVSYALSDGFSFIYNSSKTFFLQTDLTFDRKSISQYEFSTNSNNLNERPLVLTNLDYLSISVLPGFKTNSKVSFQAAFGPYFGYLIANSKTYPFQNTYSIKQQNDFDLGMSFNIGIKKRLTKKISLYFSLEDKISITQSRFSVPYNSLTFNFNMYYNIALKTKGKE